MSTVNLHNTDRSHTDDAPARGMALNVVAWTEASIRCFGVRTFRTGGLWWRAPGGSPIYLHAAIIDPHAPDAELHANLQHAQTAWAGKGLHIWDCWATRDLSSLGFRRQWQSTWYWRPPSAPLPASDLPPGLIIETVTTVDQLAAFEQATVAGFAEPDETVAPVAAFSQHAAATLDDPDMVYLNARLGRQVVASVIAHATGDALGLYGLSTLPSFRRRGYASALVAAVVALRPDLPVCVQPDPPTVPIYTRIGFVPGGQIAAWQSAAV